MGTERGTGLFKRQSYLIAQFQYNFNLLYACLPWIRQSQCLPHPGIG